MAAANCELPVVTLFLWKDYTHSDEEFQIIPYGLSPVVTWMLFGDLLLLIFQADMKYQDIF